MFLLRDRTVILTGASHGIGRALAPMLAARGTRLVLNARGAVPLEEAAAECRQAGYGAVARTVAAFKVQAGIAAEAPEITPFIFRPGIVDTRPQEQARESTGGASGEIRGQMEGNMEVRTVGGQEPGREGLIAPSSGPSRSP